MVTLHSNSNITNASNNKSSNTPNLPVTDSGKVIIRVVGAVLKVAGEAPQDTPNSRFIQAADSYRTDPVKLGYMSTDVNSGKLDPVFHEIIEDSEELIKKGLLIPEEKTGWTRTRNILMRNGITRFGDLCAVGETRLYKMGGINRISIYRIKCYLANFGLSLGDRLPEYIYGETTSITQTRLEPKWPGHPDYGLYQDENFNAPYGNTLFLKKLSSFPSALDSLQIRFLRNAGIVYFGDLLQKNEEEIKSIVGIGEKTFQLLQDLVHTNGMKLGCIELELWNIIRPSK